MKDGDLMLTEKRKNDFSLRARHSHKDLDMQKGRRDIED